MSKRQRFRGSTGAEEKPSSDNLDLMIEHARQLWKAEEGNATRAATERRILATAIVTVGGFTISKAPLIDPNRVEVAVCVIVLVAILIYLSALWAILSIRAGMPSLLRLRPYLRRARADLAKVWGRERRSRDWKGWVWRWLKRRFRRPPAPPQSASFYLRFPVPDDELFDLAAADEKFAKSAVFASVYDASMELQKRTAKDIRTVRVGTFRFALGILLTVIAAVLMMFSH